MKYLALDTCQSNLSLVLFDGQKTYTYFDKECGVKHSTDLMPKIEEILMQANLGLKDLDFIGVVIGAGSFTGIRIGVSTAKALCFASNLPCLPLSTFDTIAYNMEKGKNLAVIDAGHNGYYVAGYNDLSLELEPCYFDKEKLSELAKEYTLLSCDEVANFNVKVTSVLDGLINYLSKNCDKAISDLDKIEPLYIRKSQAEEGR